MALLIGQVSQGLETLQRRKRRLYPAGGGSPDAPSTIGWLGMPDARQQQEGDPVEACQVDGDALQTLMQSNSDGRTPRAEGMWMVQATDAAKASGSGTLGQETDRGTAEESKGIASLRKGFEHAPSSPGPPSLAACRARQRNARSPVRSVGTEARAFAAPSGCWTFASRTPTTRGVELPLLRHLDGTEDHSWHGQISWGKPSKPLAKRTCTTDFWDARLMR